MDILDRIDLFIGNVLDESVSKNKILIEPSIKDLKDLARIANYNQVRFTINSNDTLKAADAGNYTHQQVEPASSTIEIRGMIAYRDKKYFVKAYGAYDQWERSHPKVDKMIKGGMINEY